jgi:hypothetical protein
MMNPSNPPTVRGNSLIDAIRGPIILVTLGLLMAADQMDRIGIDRTWPALLILFGLLKLASYLGGGDKAPGGEQ